MFIHGKLQEHLIENAILTEQKNTGAQTLFIGRIRPEQKGNARVEYIEFTAQEELAEITAREIITECKEKYGVHSIKVWHSLGKVSSNDACFLVTVQGTHRKECFRALEYVVDEFKNRCPIFGREVMNDGSYTWKENRKYQE